MNDPSERMYERFVPRKKAQPCDYRISDHAVEQYKTRFGTGNGSIRNIIKSVLEKGELIMHDGIGNEVIHKDGVFVVVTNFEVKTVYTRYIFIEARQRIIRHWGACGNEETQQIFEE